MAASEQDAYELVDNDAYGRHRDALHWLAAHHESSPLAVATGYMSLDGLDALAQVETPVRLLIGVAPTEGALTGSPEPVTHDQFEDSVKALRRERDFSGFPASRRAMLERVGAFIASDGAEVRRYTQRFLHGKAYIFGSLTETGGLDGRGAALVTSANLTAGGLAANLELGMVHYQPTVVAKALLWHGRLWDEAEDFRDELLDLLRPPPLEVTAEDVFLRALLELYGDAPPPEPVAANALTAFQCDGLARARMIMDRYGGVLYADGVGMGKTEIGLDLIREHEQEYGHRVLVVASAQLRDSIWRPRIEDENLAAQVVSYQELAQDEQLGGDRRVLKSMDSYRLVVVDEAHAYRNGDTTWYAALSRLMSGPDKKMALLTATPVNNTLWDLHNLFLLFGQHDAAFADKPVRIPSLQQFFHDAGATRVGDERDREPSPARLFPLLDALTVRRDRVFIRKHYAGERLADGTEVKFPEPRLYERRYSLNKASQGLVRAIADRIGPPLEGEAPRPGALTMAQYRPASYRKEPCAEVARQEALAGLMLSLLLKRFESSWYAALKTVERMRRHALVRIRYLEGERDESPSVEDKDADQLDGLDKAALELLEDPGDWENPQEFSDELLEALRQDVNTLGEFAERIGRLKGRPDPKLDALREVMAETEAQKVVVFTSFRDTAEYLRRAFEDDPDLLSGREWSAVVGSEVSETERERAIDRFCPDLAAAPRKDADQYGEIDVLLSTDLLSEGQNLQQAQAVLSYDMPWNPQRVVQRNGRVIRLRSPHETALLYTLMPEDAELTELLGLEARLQAKIQAANASIGMDAPVLATQESESRIFEGLNDYVGRLSRNDSSLLDEDGGPGGAVSAGEEYRRRVARAVSEGDARRVQEMPWGIGAAIARGAEELDQPAVFFACRTRDGLRYWRMVSASGTILHRDDLPMLRLIDPTDQEPRAIPADLDLERLFAVAAADILEEHAKPVEKPKPPASQRWALIDILGAAGAPDGADYNHAADVLSAPQSTPVRRALSELRREYGQGGMSLRDCAARILDVVKRFRLRPVTLPKEPLPITSEDIGVVCYQVVLPQGD